MKGQAPTFEGQVEFRREPDGSVTCVRADTYAACTLDLLVAADPKLVELHQGDLVFRTKPPVAYEVVGYDWMRKVLQIVRVPWVEPVGTEANPFTHGTEDHRERQRKWCRCHDCGLVAVCTPANDFFTRGDYEKDPALKVGPLVCQPCLMKGAGR